MSPTSYWHLSMFLIKCYYLRRLFVFSIESNGHGRTSTRLNANVQFDMDTAVDITPTKDGGVLKKMVNLGVGSLGYPLSNDTVIVKWKMYDRNYDLVHSSDVLSEPFDFVVDAQPTQVISAWEIAVKTMFQGEIAMLYIQPSYGFGAEGAEGIIAPNASMICELNLVEIIPAITRQYKSVGYNESITDELLDNIRSGKSPIAQNVMDNKPIEERKSDKQRKMFDPTKHKVDPNQRVTGKGQKFIWDENPSSMEVQIKLPESIKSKQDLEVDIRCVEQIYGDYGIEFRVVEYVVAHISGLWNVYCPNSFPSHRMIH